MSFSSAVKQDLARIKPSLNCCRLAEFTAFLRATGSIHIGNNQQIAISMASEHSQAIRLIFTLVKELFGLNTQITVHKKTSLNKNKVYTINIPSQPGIEKILELLGISDPQSIFGAGKTDAINKVNNNLLSRPCCRRSYLRGAFLGSGSINSPKGDYHLEISSNDSNNAKLIKNLFEDIDITAKITQRKQIYVVYLKGAEDIADTLAMLGSHRSLLDFENIRIEKGIRNHVNRQMNCENANLNRTVASAENQTNDIKLIAKKMGLDKLPITLRQAAEARLSNPESSLSDLAADLGIGRSGVNHRLRRIKQIADMLREKG